MTAQRTQTGSRVAIVIPVFNGWDLTARCLDALEGDVEAKVVSQIVVVDDGSSDGTRERISADPRLTAVLLERNHGFAGACNAGARATNGSRVLLFLNNDAFAQPGSVAALCLALADETVGIAGPKLVYDDGTIQSAGMAFTRRGLEVLHYHLDGDLPDASVARDYPAVTGAALMIRRELFDRLGGFDESYVNGVEDIDLCLRAWNLGYRVRYEPASVFVHVEGATRGRTPADDDNHARLWARSAAQRRAMPAIRIPSSPAYLIDGRGARSAQDRAIVAMICDGLRRYGGAPVERIARSSDVFLGHVRALAEGRSTLSIAVGSAPHSADVLFVAPANARAAATARDANVHSWWAPTIRTMERLIAAGAPRDRTHLVFTGVDRLTRDPQPVQRSGVVILIDSDSITDAECLARRFDPSALTLLVLDESGPDLLQARFPTAGILCNKDDPQGAKRLIEGAELVVAVAEDLYGTLVPPALAAGCLVATIPDGRAPWCTEGSAILAPLDSLAERCCFALGDGEYAQSLRSAAKRDAARRFPFVHGMARMRELARAAIHGPLDGSEAQITPATAARLRSNP
jgi:GT2 family glycosyltransferase